MSKRLITGIQVINYSDLEDDAVLSKIEKRIPVVEIQFRKHIFGASLYDKMLTVRVDFSCAKQWNKNTAYELNKLVIFGQQYWKSKEASNTGNVPCDSDKWEIAKPFTNDCYNNLWENGLREYLAYKVAANVVLPLSFPVGAKGGYDYAEDKTGTRSISERKMSRVENNYDQTAETWLLEVKEYIENNKENCTDFASAKFLNACSDTVSRGNLLSRFGKKKRMRNEFDKA